MLCSVCCCVCCDVFDVLCWEKSNIILSGLVKDSCHSSGWCPSAKTLICSGVLCLVCCVVLGCSAACCAGLCSSVVQHAVLCWAHVLCAGVFSSNASIHHVNTTLGGSNSKCLARHADNTRHTPFRSSDKPSSNTIKPRSNTHCIHQSINHKQHWVAVNCPAQLS